MFLRPWSLASAVGSRLHTGGHSICSSSSGHSQGEHLLSRTLSGYLCCSTNTNIICCQYSQSQCFEFIIIIIHNVIPMLPLNICIYAHRHTYAHIYIYKCKKYIYVVNRLKDFEAAAPIVRWLSIQRTSNGGFQSTQVKCIHTFKCTIHLFCVSVLSWSSVHMICLCFILWVSFSMCCPVNHHGVSGTCRVLDQC